MLIFSTESDGGFFLFSVASVPLLSTLGCLQLLFFLFWCWLVFGVFFPSTLIPSSFPFPIFFFEWHDGKLVPHSFFQLLWLLHLVFSDFRSGRPSGCPSGELFRCRKEQVFLFSKVCVRTCSLNQQIPPRCHDSGLPTPQNTVGKSWQRLRCECRY